MVLIRSLCIEEQNQFKRAQEMDCIVRARSQSTSAPLRCELGAGLRSHPAGDVMKGKPGLSEGKQR